jgi:Protein of unknown function (DUF4240)
MDRDRFWILIEQARTAGGDCEQLTARLVALLRGYRPARSWTSSSCWTSCWRSHFATPLWGAAVLINAGCSDDGFERFVAG